MRWRVEGEVRPLEWLMFGGEQHFAPSRNAGVTGPFRIAEGVFEHTLLIQLGWIRYSRYC